MNRFENPLTRQDVETVIEKSVGSGVSILGYHLTPYSDKVLGFLGAHRNLVVEALPDGSQSKRIHTYFVKSIPYHIERRAKFVKENKIFYREARFFKFIMPELMRSSKDKSWAAQCYLAKDDALVFEHLQLKNYKLKNKFLDVPSLKAALSSVAKMHAASVLTEKRLGKTFAEMYPSLIDEIVFTRDGPFAHGIGLGIDTATKVAEYLGLNYEVVARVCNLIFEKILPSKTRQNVLCHGDVWLNNFMFDDKNCALVDFQLIRYVPAMTDVTQLIYYNARRELREKCETDLLKHYHEVLCEILKDAGEMTCPKFQDILDEYEERRIIGIVTINLYFPTNQVDGETLAEMIEDPDRLDRLMARDRANVVFEMMKENEGYKELIESTVRELVEVSDKFLK
ncbi:uncharacterized protein LOC131666425 [Phymastichus coffea]|uniref:uncharacterized protein LOC131666425 n=1 Tax=Phymastichus coffea TaxID=108790 RepID=UPI00273BC839|nr:uncharacterized protein LOC131666425 [Phymastichus coffea]